MIINNEQIRASIINQLHRDQMVDTSDLTVEVKDGEVKLKGGIPSFNARMAAYFDAIAVPGVASVDNELEVERPSVLSSPTDDEIKTRVENKLRCNADIGSSNITVSVKARRVSLNGCVDAYWEKMKAEELVLGTIGVVEVENALSVVITESWVDRQIADEIISALKSRPDFDTNWVDLIVEDRVVTLSGTLPDWSTLQAVEPIAKHVSGVRDVVNDLVAVAF